MKKLRDLQLPKLRAQASIAPDTLDAESRTVEVRFYSGASVQRFPLFDDPYELTFSLDEKSVRLDRFNAGAPLVDNHDAYGSVSQVVLGVVEKAWLDKDGGRARVKIAADRPDILARIQDGILRNFSMGAVIHKLCDVTEKDDSQRRLLAVDWEPHELSIVPVPADMGAQALATAERFPCQLSGASAPMKESKVDKNIKVRLLETGEVVEISEQDFDETLHLREIPEKKQTANPVSVAREVDEAIERDQLLAGQVQRAAEHYGLDDIWAQRHINLGTPIKTVLKLAAEERAKRAPKSRTDIGFGVDHDAPQYRAEQMASAIASRATGKPVPDSAKAYANFGFVDIGHEILKANRQDYGVDIRNRPEVIRLALSTSDFPNLLANAGNKIMLPAYDAATATYRMLCMRQDLPDFKSASVLNVGDFPAPVQVGEGGEIQLGYFGEQKNTVALLTYGRRLALTRQSLINDDLNSFGRVMGAYGQRIADFENATFFTLLSTVGPTLGDGGAMFNATAVTTATGHANYTASGTAISDTSISVGAEMMMRQTGIGSSGLGDGIKLNIQPKYLLAAPGKRNLAFQYTSASYVPSAPTSQNPWAGVLTPLFDANLSGNRWWLFADPGLAPNFAYGSLAGAPGPRVQTRPGFETEGVELRVAFDFYVGGIDFRGGYCNAGA